MSFDIDFDIVLYMRQQWHLSPFNSREKNIFEFYECCITVKSNLSSIFCCPDFYQGHHVHTPHIMRNFMASWRFLICRWNGSVYANSTNISKYCIVFADVLVQYLSIQPIQLLRRQCCLGDSCERNMIFHITHEYMFPHLQEEGNLLDRCAGVHVFESRIISSACFHPDDDVHWGKANFAHTDTSQLSRDLRVSLQEHMFTFSKLSRPLEIKLSRQ